MNYLAPLLDNCSALLDLWTYVIKIPLHCIENKSWNGTLICHQVFTSQRRFSANIDMFVATQNTTRHLLISLMGFPAQHSSTERTGGISCWIQILIEVIVIVERWIVMVRIWIVCVCVQWCLIKGWDINDEEQTLLSNLFTQMGKFPYGRQLKRLKEQNN